MLLLPPPQMPSFASLPPALHALPPARHRPASREWSRGPPTPSARARAVTPGAAPQPRPALPQRLLGAGRVLSSAVAPDPCKPPPHLLDLVSGDGYRNPSREPERGVPHRPAGYVIALPTPQLPEVGGSPALRVRVAYKPRRLCE